MGQVHCEYEMKADLRFKIAAIALFCITCAGTTMALVSLDGPISGSGTSLNDLGTLRPSLDPQLDRQPLALRESLDRPLSAGSEDASAASGPPEPFPALRPLLAPRHPRLAFIDPGVGEIELPEEPITVAGTPESWSVEVTEQPVTSARKKQSAPTKRSRKAAKKKRKTRYTLKQRLAEISPTALSRVKAKFATAKASWPPAEIAMVSIKDEKALELYARPATGEWKFVHRYKVLAASGATGPKLVRGDKQVPEGVYRISYLNPNSAYHVSLRVSYPNAFDRKMAKKDGRRDLGGDIMIHGKNVSAGCLAVGDRSAEELFLIAAEVGTRNIKVVIAPTDFRKTPPTELLKERGTNKGPQWVPELYTQIASEMTDFKPPPPAPSLLSVLGF